MSRSNRPVFSALSPLTTAFGGAGHVNAVAHATLAERFRLVDRPADGEVQFGTTIQDLAATPRRVLLDHGAFADATFWAFVAPRLTAADTIAVTSRVGRALAARMWGGIAPTIVDLPLFADTETFRPAADRAAERRAFARRFDLDETAPWILAVGSYAARKNTHLAVGFLAALRRLSPSARLLLVLPQAESASHCRTAAFLDRTIEDLDQATAIRRLPPLPSRELARVMAASDLFVHLTTCRLENFGLVVAEAMASGLPVLAADWGGLRDLVVPAQTGWLAPTHLSRRGPRVRWHAQVAGIARALADGAQRSAMSLASRERAERFSVARFRDGVAATVAYALDGSAVSRPVTLGPDAEDLRFAAIWLQTKHPEVRDTSTLFRFLLDLEEGRFAELLLGAAATSVAPPPLVAGAEVRPAVAYTVVSDASIRVDDPAWAEELHVGAEAARLARKVLGGAPLEADDLEAAEELARLGLI